MYCYLGQCDKLRKTTLGEQRWQQMMALKVPISLEDFENLCKLETLLDEGESLEEFIREDPTSGFYSSIWGGTPCLFIQVSGFEFIFVEE